MPIKVSDVSCVYNRGLPTEVQALDNVSFSAERSEVVSVVGRTGSGKSTLAQHLNGLIVPQSGEVTVDGVKITSDRKILRTIRGLVGYVFQYPEQQIFAETVEEEISFGPLKWGVNGAELHRRVSNAMKQMGLDASLLKQNPFSLSGGQKRRVAIASVMAAEPSYVVFDEPTAGLDAAGIKDFVLMLKNCVSAGCGIINITHDIDLALDISSHILVLDGGKNVSWGTPAETAEKLCAGTIKNIAVPEVLKLSSMLKNAGKTDRLCWDPYELADMITEVGT
jgi:energy-coupling factor transport system ATP-binding protein